MLCCFFIWEFFFLVVWNCFSICWKKEFDNVGKNCGSLFFSFFLSYMCFFGRMRMGGKKKEKEGFWHYIYGKKKKLYVHSLEKMKILLLFKFITF